MSGTPHVEHPNHHLPEKMVLFANQKKTSIQAGNRGLTVGLLAFPPNMPIKGYQPNMHHGCMRVGSRLATSIHSSPQK